MRHIRGEKRLRRWQNRVSAFVPDHSKAPRSRQTLNVMGVGTADTPTLSRKLRKLAEEVELAMSMVSLLRIAPRLDLKWLGNEGE